MADRPVHRRYGVTASTVKGPKTVGPNLMELTIREQAASAWAQQAAEDRRKAERSALNLARTIFGNVGIEFDDFVPDEFGKRHRYEPRHLVTFEVEGLEFNYAAATKDYPDRLVLVDPCPCGRGPRLLGSIYRLADLGRLHSFDHSDVKCASCRDDEKKAE